MAEKCDNGIDLPCPNVNVETPILVNPVLPDCNEMETPNVNYNNTPNTRPRPRVTFHPYEEGPRQNGQTRSKTSSRGSRPPWPSNMNQFSPRMPRPNNNKTNGQSLTLPPVPPGVREEVWEWFFNADEDKDGCITPREVQRILLNGKWRPFNEETCKMMVYMMDTEKTGTLDAYEMNALWDYLNEWKRVFDTINDEGSHTMKASNLFRALESLGYRLSSELCDAVIARFDDHGDGKLSFNDFIQTCIMLRSLTEVFKSQDVKREGVINLHFEQFIEMVLDNAMGFTRSAGLSA